jgi:hypothetical protein
MSGCEDVKRFQVGSNIWDCHILTFSLPHLHRSVGHVDFSYLHLRTEYSLLDGACRIDELLDQAVRLKMPAIAVTGTATCFRR